MAKTGGLAEVLVALAANSATLIERARASGMFKQPETVDATVTPAPAPTAAAATDASTKALQDIIVQQAMRIHALEAEVLRLTPSA